MRNCLNEGKHFGYPHIVTFAGDKLVIGSGSDLVDMRKLYVINITEDMIHSENGIRVEPALLLGNAYEMAQQYGGGNPITAVPKKFLEKVLSDKSSRIAA